MQYIQTSLNGKPADWPENLLMQMEQLEVITMQKLDSIRQIMAAIKEELNRGQAQ